MERNQWCGMYHSIRGHWVGALSSVDGMVSSSMERVSTRMNHTSSSSAHTDDSRPQWVDLTGDSAMAFRGVFTPWTIGTWTGLSGRRFAHATCDRGQSVCLPVAPPLSSVSSDEPFQWYQVMVPHQDLTTLTGKYLLLQVTNPPLHRPLLLRFSTEPLLLLSIHHIPAASGCGRSSLWCSLSSPSLSI